MPFKADHALHLLTRAHQLGRLAHAYLITGPREADKEGFAAQTLSLATSHPQPALDAWAQQGAVILRPQSKSRRISVGESADEVGTMRYLERMIHRTVGPGGQKLGVIVDAERMTQQAQNTFLKTLEEPPEQTLLLLLTSYPEQLLPTILSRVIEIPLLPPPGERQYDEHEQRLLNVLSQLNSTGRESPGIGSALAIKTEFQAILDALHDAIKEEQEALFDKEVEHYKQTTDGAWLKQREEQITAQIQALYLQRRESIMDLLLAWVGDISRQQVHAPHLELSRYRAATQRLSQCWTQTETNRRLKALLKLEKHMHTNASEGLALEVCFIEAFGR
jgi:DNA polymerase III subunit delta'